MYAKESEKTGLSPACATHSVTRLDRQFPMLGQVERGAVDNYFFFCSGSDSVDVDESGQVSEADRFRQAGSVSSKLASATTVPLIWTSRRC